jgi:hypothetical protein
MFKLFSDMYFIVYKLYYVGQNDDLDIRARLRNWDEGNTFYLSRTIKIEAPSLVVPYFLKYFKNTAVSKNNTVLKTLRCLALRNIFKTKVSQKTMVFLKYKKKKVRPSFF